MSPRLFHLLGRWQDNQLIFDALPNRPDLFKVEKSGNDCYFVINQFETCLEANHEHFPKAATALFPGAENGDPVGPPEPNNYNWQPWQQENQLWNWNLHEAEENWAYVGFYRETKRWN